MSYIQILSSGGFLDVLLKNLKKNTLNSSLKLLSSGCFLLNRLKLDPRLKTEGNSLEAS